MAGAPSIIPPGARVLSDDERRALVEEMAEIVRRSHLFDTLDDEGRRRVLISGYVCTFGVGEVLMVQGEPGSTMYLLLNGRVKVETENEGETLELAELGRDACVGEVSVLSGGPRTATVRALTDVDAVGFERHRIRRILEDYPEVRTKLEALIEGRARDTIDKIVNS